MALKRRMLLAVLGSSVGVGSVGCLGNTWVLGNNIECESVDNYETLADYPTVDEPPHTVPGSNDDHYLGACLSDDPSLDFESFDDHPISSSLDWEDLGTAMDDGEAEFWVGLARSEDEFERLFDHDEAGDEFRERVADIDFDETALVAGYFGWTTPTYEPRLVRAEEREGALHLHGYLVRPDEVADESDVHRFLYAVHHGGNRPDYAMMSLTIDEDTRVNFDSEEGSVRIPRSPLCPPGWDSCKSEIS